MNAQQNGKTWQVTLFAMLSLLLASAIAFGAIGVVQPSSIESYSWVENRTTGYYMGASFNYTRGFINVININDTFPSIKWVGFIGNVSGRIGLMDSSNKTLYDWTVVTTTGEVYATKEGSGTDVGGVDDGNQGGIPVWQNVTCANQSMVDYETGRLNHSLLDVDRLNTTFTSGAAFTLGEFYVGEKQITDTTMPQGQAGNCFGINLNQNDTDVSAGGVWQEVLLTDMSYEQDPTVIEYDLIYAAKIYNNTYGYDGVTYDFQMMVPQFGNNGTVSNIAYYFYIELR